MNRNGQLPDGNLEDRGYCQGLHNPEAFVEFIWTIFLGLFCSVFDCETWNECSLGYRTGQKKSKTFGLCHSFHCILKSSSSVWLLCFEFISCLSEGHSCHLFLEVWKVWDPTTFRQIEELISSTVWKQYKNVLFLLCISQFLVMVSFVSFLTRLNNTLIFSFFSWQRFLEVAIK